MTRAFRSAALLLMLPALALGACGGSSADDEARKLQSTSIVAKDDPVRKFLVSDADIRKAPADGPGRAFLTFWSELQFQAWSTAARAYEPGLRQALGTDVLIRSLANQSGSFLSTKPVISKIRRIGTTRAVISYFRLSADGSQPSSLEMIKVPDGRWLISYDPALDTAMAQLVELEAQQMLDPLAQKSVPGAVRAGNKARRLQSEYLERSRRTVSPQP